MASGFFLVTGGNRGLGLEVCSRLVESGRNVILCSRDGPAGQSAAAKLAQDSPQSGSCISLQVDMNSKDSVTALAETVNAKFGGELQALINNAAIYNGGWDGKAWAQFHGTNYAGPVLLTQLLASSLKTGAHIVMLTSGLGQRRNLSPAYAAEVAQAACLDDLQALSFRPDSDMASSFNPCYCLSKAMVNRAVQLLAADPALSQRRITVTAVDPGWCRTRMGGMSAPRSQQQGAQSVMAALELSHLDSGTVRSSDGRSIAL